MGLRFKNRLNFALNLNDVNLISKSFLVSDEMIKKRVLRTGDGSHRYAQEALTEANLNKETEKDVVHYWGFGKILYFSLV